MVKIFNEHIYWKHRKLIFTRHFKEEFNELRKNIEIIQDFLDMGEHKLISKKQQKYEVYFWLRKTRYCMSYVIEDDAIVLIYVKPKKK